MGDQRRAPTLEAVKSLILEAQPQPLITIYMPTHKAAAPPLMREDRLRFKNLSQKAIEIARTKYNLDTKRTRDLRRQFNATLDDLEFWEHQSESLVACVSPESSAVFNLPVDCDEYITIDIRFHLAPVIGLLEYAEPYYVLLVTQKNPALFAGDMYHLAPTTTPLPKSTGDALHIDEWKERSLQFHSTTEGAGAQWHGQGGAKDRGDDERRFYLKSIDHIITGKTDTSRPLILAGTAELTEEFRRYSRHPYILGGHIHHLNTTQELFTAARQKIYRDTILHRQNRLAHTFKQRQGRGSTSSDHDAIQNAMQKHNIETILLGIIHHTTDTTRNGTAGQIVTKIKPLEDNLMRAIDYIATRTWCLGGNVSILHQPLLQPHAFAAIHRY